MGLAGDEGEVLEGDFGSAESALLGWNEYNGDFVELAESGGGDGEVEGVVDGGAGEG